MPNQPWLAFRITLQRKMQRMQLRMVRYVIQAHLLTDEEY